MKEKYEIIDDFPNSFTKYQTSLIFEILRGESLNPCDIMYEREDLRDEPKDEMIETLAFDYLESIQLFLDAKNHMFNSRRISSKKLSDYLKSAYDYDPVKISEFEDDKNALFLILFYKTYNPTKNSIDIKKFNEARAAAYKFKDKRDRMTEVDGAINLSNIKDKIGDFEEVMESDLSQTSTYIYHNDHMSELTVLFLKEDGRSYEPRFNNRIGSTSDYSITYQEEYPIKENALYFKTKGDKTEIQSRSSVNSWEEAFMRFFTITLDEDYTGKLKQTESSKAKEIVENVKEQSDDDNASEQSGSQMLAVINNDVQKAVSDADLEDSSLTKDTVKEKISKMKVTGIEVDGEETVFEIHHKSGISILLDEYEGMSESLSQAVSNAKKEDITIYAEVPSHTSEENDEVVLEDGEWYMSSVKSQNTMKALEAIL